MTTTNPSVHISKTAALCAITVPDYIYFAHLSLFTLHSFAHSVFGFIQLEATKATFKVTAKCDYGKVRDIFGNGKYFEEMPAVSIDGMIWVFRVYPNGINGLARKKESNVMAILVNAYEYIDENNKEDKVSIYAQVSNEQVCCLCFQSVLDIRAWFYAENQTLCLERFHQR